MKGFLKTAFVAVAAVAAAACGESAGEVDEYAGWQEKNDQYYFDVYSKAAPGKTLIKAWSLPDFVAASVHNSIVVEVLEEGPAGTPHPIYTDTVKAHLSARTIPTATYPAGRVFDQTWTGEFDPETAAPRTMPVAGTAVVNGEGKPVTDGLTTALMQMRKGDRWRVYVPYSLAYGAADNASFGIPAFSTVIYDVTLAGIFHVGEAVPQTMAKRAGFQ